MERHDTKKILKPGKTQFIAHRGLSGLETENTMAAFIAAGNRAAFYGIETDVHCCYDGHYVLSHDSSLRRIAGDGGEIEGMTFQTLRAIELQDKYSGEKAPHLRYPTLQEYVRNCKKYGKVGVLEIKTDMSMKQIRDIVKIIEKEEYLDGITFISFFYSACAKVRKLLPEQNVQFLTGDNSDELIEKLKADKLDIDIVQSALTEERVKAYHKAGIKVNCWTVDELSDAERLVSWGVDYITTNIIEPVR